MSDSLDEIINVNVIIADRPYPLKIKRSEEENIRLAARDINEKVKQFQQAYAAKDKQDYLAMCTMMYAVDNLNYKQKNLGHDSNLELELTKLQKAIDNIVNA
jgi:cell division protein ZapA